MKVLQGYLVLGWLLLASITRSAIMENGLEGGNVFITDFTHPWRAQFNTDFVLYALPIAAWVVWREHSKLVGVLCAIGTLAGGVFTLPYVLVASIRARGDVRRLLLGHHA